MTEAGDRRPIAARELKVMEALAARLVRQGASANAISLAGMFAGLGAGLALAALWWLAPLPDLWRRALWLLAAVLVQLRLLANLLDGMVAIGRGIASPVGELFNEVPDRVSDSAVLIGLGAAAGGSWGLGLAAALAAMATAYIRAVGKAAGAGSDFSGPMAKQQRMALVTALAAWCVLTPGAWSTAPLVGGLNLPALVLLVITVLATLTAIRRLSRIAGALRVKGTNIKGSRA